MDWQGVAGECEHFGLRSRRGRGEQGQAGEVRKKDASEWVSGVPTPNFPVHQAYTEMILKKEGFSYNWLWYLVAMEGFEPPTE